MDQTSNSYLESNHRTAAGNPENQDRGAIIRRGKAMLLIVADGAGGISGGKEAAQLAIDFIGERINLLKDADLCSEILFKMDETIAAHPIAGATTCAFAVIDHAKIIGASVGDSAVWKIGESGISDLTQNQTRKPMIGSGRARPIAFSDSWTKGQSILLATDGLLKYTSHEKIAEVCRMNSSEIAAEKLIELVRYPSRNLPDDVTVVLARLL